MKIFPRGSTDVCAAGAAFAATRGDGCRNSVTMSGIPSTERDHVMAL